MDINLNSEEKKTKKETNWSESGKNGSTNFIAE